MRSGGNAPDAANLTAEPGVDRKQIVGRGYWKLDTVNHPTMTAARTFDEGHRYAPAQVKSGHW
jgi:hypothetical protein